MNHGKVKAYVWNYKYFDVTLLGIICLIFLSCNWLWLRQLDIMPHGDRLTHLIYSLSYAYANDLRDCLVSTKPPLIYCWTSIFYRMLGNSITIARLSLSWFWIILLFSAYGIGKFVAGRLAGWGAVLLCLSSLPLMRFSHFYQSDFPLVSMVALSLFFYLRAEEFTNKNYSLLFGLSLGLGVLTKYSFGFFWLIPTLYIYIKLFLRAIRTTVGRIIALEIFLAALWFLLAWTLSYKLGNEAFVLAISNYALIFAALGFLVLWTGLSLLERRAGENGFLPLIYGLKALVMAFTVAGPWYLPRLPLYYRDLLFHMPDYAVQSGASGCNSMLFNLETVFYFLPLFPVLLLLGIGEIFRRKCLPQLGPLLLNLVASFVLVSLTVPEEPRHIAPFLSLLLPFMALGLLWLENVKRSAAFVIVAVALYLVPLPHGNYITQQFMEMSNAEQQVFVSRAETIARYIARSTPGKNQQTIIVSPNPMLFNRYETGQLSYVFYLRGVKSCYFWPRQLLDNVAQVYRNFKGRKTQVFVLMINQDEKFKHILRSKLHQEGLHLSKLKAFPLLYGFQGQLYKIF